MEAKRLSRLCVYENQLYGLGYRYIAGLDEAGRGSLAGPLVASAVILDREKLLIENIDDSKKLCPAARQTVFKTIMNSCLSWSVAEVSPATIDEVHISKANALAFERAIDKLHIKPDIILSDYFKTHTGIESIPLPKGESVSVSIAAASIIAKVTRDRIMVGLDHDFPEYGFGGHKGYGTKHHLLTLQKYGPCEIHRLSFTGVLS